MEGATVKREIDDKKSEFLTVGFDIQKEGTFNTTSWIPKSALKVEGQICKSTKNTKYW